MTFSPALSREFRPYKPDPAPLLHIFSTWGVQPNEVMMVGDSLRDDVCVLPLCIFFFGSTQRKFYKSYIRLRLNTDSIASKEM